MSEHIPPPNDSSVSHRKLVVIVGLKRKHIDILHHLATRWQVVVIEKSEAVPPDWFKASDRLVYLTADASSILVWEKLKQKGLEAVISTVSDVALNRELCHIIHDRLKLKPLFFILAEDRFHQGNIELKEKYAVRLISPSSLVQEVLLNQLLTRTKIPLNIGLGKGELLEVEISARSHLVDRPLKYLRPKEWHIAAIYRRGKLLLPTGDVMLQVGDRVVLAGDPTVLANLVGALLKGEPQFPKPYGSRITVPLQELRQPLADELSLWARGCPVSGVQLVPLNVNMAESVRSQLETGIQKPVVQNRHLSWRSFWTAIPPDSGLVVVSRSLKSWKRIFRIGDGMVSMPILLAGGRIPYSKVVAGLDGEWPDLILDSALDVSRVLGLPLETYFTHEPWEIGGDRSVRKGVLRESLIKDLATIHGLSLPVHHFSGNPVTEASAWLKGQDNPLLVIGFRPGAYPGWMLGKPVVAPLLCERFPGSVLLIPGTDMKEAGS